MSTAPARKHPRQSKRRDDVPVERAVPPSRVGPARRGARWQTLGTRDASLSARASDRVGGELRKAFARLLAALPGEVSKVADIVRFLGLDRAICQRVMMGVRDADDGLGVIERFPGVRGLERFVDACGQKRVDAAALAAARAAIAGYARLVGRAGGSQAKLVGGIHRLRSRSNGDDAPPGVRHRQQMHDAAAAITGLDSAARVELVIVAPSPDGLVTTLSATSFVGVEARPHAMPLVRRSRLPGLHPVPGHGPASGLTPGLLLEAFTSRPAPAVTTRTLGESLLQVIDLEQARGRPIDVTAALHFSWRWGEPAGDGDFYSVGRVIGTPARRLVMDVYLHRDLPAPRGVGAHVIRPSTLGSLGNHRPQSRWFDRLPIEHDLLLLGGDAGGRPSEAWPRLGELTRHLIATQHWSPDAFNGYRLELEYPLFDMEYVIAAEWRRDATTTRGAADAD